MTAIRRLAAAALCIAATFLQASPPQDRPLTGTWCLQDEDLVIEFVGDDSVVVSSSSDEGISGRGMYERQDTVFVASIASEDLEIRMGYRYEWVSDSTITAQTLFLTVNGDSVNHPEGNIPMLRCAPSPPGRQTE
jgi:hypothetical protein